jgi:hypothetical protein
MRIKTSELAGAALDWAVATCEGRTIRRDPMGFGVHSSEGGYWIWEDQGVAHSTTVYSKIGRAYSPSTDWAQGGPILDREEITIDYRDGETQARKWDDTTQEFLSARAARRQGLIAGMRCHVASKLGAEIEVPDELAGCQS